MPFKTVFTTLTDPATARMQLDRAVEMATAHGSHVDVLCLGVDRSNLGYFYEGASAIALQESIDQSRADAADLAKLAEEHLRLAGVEFSTEEDFSQMADLGRHVAQRARFADIVVLPMPYGAGKGGEIEPVLEAALFEGQAPVLVVPDNVALNPKPRQVVLGWNESSESLRAIRKSLPLLRQADLARVVVVDPPSSGSDRSEPGSAVARYLARHGVKTEIDVLAKTSSKVSEVLKQHATETGSDMLVMGAYGHSRFREAILGGATRNMLEGAPVPVFLAH